MLVYINKAGIMNRNTKNVVLNVILCITVVLIVGLTIFGIVSTKKRASEEDAKDNSGFVAGFDEAEVYHLTEKTIVDFYEPIIEQFNKESQLVVSSADASMEMNLKQTGVFDIKALNKSQKIKYKGTGRFYIDMSEMSRDDVVVDNENKVVTITIPHSKMLPIDIDPNRFESEDAKKGLLAFGDLKFTPKEYNDLQTEVKAQIEKKVDTKENRVKADENAMEEMVKIYEPIVQALDSEYTVSIQFRNNLGSNE